MSNPQPLKGLRVLEFSHTIMGPCAGLVLADLGADVVKVEPAPAGDHTRRLPGFAAGFFATFNRNKRSIALDLKHPDGRAAAHRLAARADLVLENYGPGTMERLGCGWEDLRPANPRLVYLALKGFLAGPYEHRPALDEVVQFQIGPRLHDRAAGPAAARRRLDHRYPRRGLRRDRGAGGVAGAGCHGAGPAGQQFAVRKRGVPDGQPHGRPRRHRRAAAADAGPPRCLGHLRRLHHRRRWPVVRRRHQRPAMGPLHRGLRPARDGRRRPARHQCPARQGARPG